MNTEFFIARRLIFDKSSKKTISRSILSIAVFGVGLSLAVMIVAVTVVTGFKNEITNKVIGFGSHIQILNFDSNISYETQPINKNQSFLNDLRAEPYIQNIQSFATKAGIIKTRTDIQGVVLKGIGSDFNWDFFQNYLTDGDIFMVYDSVRTNKVLISKYIATLLKLQVGDEFIMYFVQDPPRMRRFEVSGIYETSLEEFDRIFVLADISHIQRLNDWTENQISGFELSIYNFNHLEELTYEIMNLVGFGFEEDGSRLKVINIRDKYPQIFDWLSLQDINVLILILLMIVVAGFNMVSGLLILILDRTSMIGILKALGTENFSIRRIFLYQSGFLIIKGLFWGNLIGLTLCLIQKEFGIMKLDQSSYYLTTVPINLNLFHFLAINIGTCLVIMMILIIPSLIISRISPIKVIRFN
ncbi:MAG: ABC transporter permease [Bacteroides sp. SM23_62_1]|nr:MAG: ABC transporter permease [Bacteroides sp. SM23_62_1]